MRLQVYKIHSDFYYVKNCAKNGHEFFVCKLKDVLKKAKQDVVVGDFVDLSDDNNFIVSVKKRKNYINRPKTANVDLALVMSAFKEPGLDFIQLNRYLCYLKYYNIPCVICINKEDLETDYENVVAKVKQIYEPLNYKIFFISAKNNIGLDELKEFVKNKTVVLAGLSGVGKSTLLNSLSKNNLVKTGKVSQKTLKGTHTTRHLEIVDFDGFKIIDTPGFSKLKFDFILPNQVIDLFDDLKIYKEGCRYSNCLHNAKEIGICNVFDNSDKINISRYESYLCFLDEAIEYKKEISKKSIKKEELKKLSGDKTKVKISKRKREASRNTINQKIDKEK